jgi:UDP-2,4-diacetamido-2,4,6-trideoxy-beta-L-altropyranose hydrolase
MKVLFRADANARIGIGHVMRCLALAEACQDAGEEVSFACCELTSNAEDSLREHSINIVRVHGVPGSSEDAKQFSERVKSCDVDWVVIDGYHFGPDYTARLLGLGTKILMIDDHGSVETNADILLNANAYAAPDLYREAYQTPSRLLLGTQFALLRREFSEWRNWQRTICADARKVLLLVGGTDPTGLSTLFLDAVQLLEEQHLEITLASAGRTSPTVSATQSSASIRILQNSSDLAARMAGADIAVSAAGSTCLELAFMGLPAVVVDVVENQKPVASELHRRGVAIHAGSQSDITPSTIANGLRRLLASSELRKIMSRRGRELVDGYGAQRVLGAMRRENIHLRPVRDEDSRLLWEWANDPVVRRVSFSTEPINWDTHSTWLRNKLSDPNCRLYVIECGRRSIGQIRFEMEQNSAVISLSMAPDCRGQGLGTAALQAAMEQLFHTATVKQADAFVKKDNTASLRLFQKAGFEEHPSTTKASAGAVHFILEREKANGRILRN